MTPNEMADALEGMELLSDFTVEEMKVLAAAIAHLRAPAAPAPILAVTDEMAEAGARSIIDGQENRPGTSWAEEATFAFRAMVAAAPRITRAPAALPELPPLPVPVAWYAPQGEGFRMRLCDEKPTDGPLWDAIYDADQMNERYCQGFRDALAGRGQDQADAIPAISLTRDLNGRCIVSIEVGDKWVDVIRDSGDIISHIVTESGIRSAIAAAGKEKA